MKHQINSVKIFHEVYKLSYKDSPVADIGIDKINLRFKLMAEENQEYFEAAKIMILLKLLMHLEICFIFCVELLLNMVCKIKLKRFLTKSKKVI